MWNVLYQVLLKYNLTYAHERGYGYTNVFASRFPKENLLKFRYSVGNQGILKENLSQFIIPPEQSYLIDNLLIQKNDLFVKYTLKTQNKFRIKELDHFL